MDVEVTREAGKPGQSGKPVRGLWRYKLIEAIGLVLLLYGLASSAWMVALAGGATILAIYALFRRRHGVVPSDPQGSAGMADDGGGGD